MAELLLVFTKDYSPRVCLSLSSTRKKNRRSVFRRCSRVVCSCLRAYSDMLLILLFSCSFSRVVWRLSQSLVTYCCFPVYAPGVVWRLTKYLVAYCLFFCFPVDAPWLCRLRLAKSLVAYCLLCFPVDSPGLFGG